QDRGSSRGGAVVPREAPPEVRRTLTHGSLRAILALRSRTPAPLGGPAGAARERHPPEWRPSMAARDTHGSLRAILALRSRTPAPLGGPAGVARKRHPPEWRPSIAARDTVKRPPHPLSAAELAEAALLGDLAVVLIVLGWVLPGGALFQVAAVTPFAALAARRRTRAVVLGTLAAMTVSF